MVRTTRVERALRARERGFTLVESVLALVILAFAAVALGYTISSGQAHALEARERHLATFLAKWKLTGLLDLPYGTWVPTGPLPAGPDFPEFTYQILVAEGLTHDFNDVGVSATGTRVTVVVRKGPREMARVSAVAYQP